MACQRCFRRDNGTMYCDRCEARNEAEQEQAERTEGVTPFCIPGGHAYKAPTGTMYDGVGLPEDWYMTRASFDRERQVWYYDEHALGTVCHCGEHPITPEGMESS